MALRIWLRVRVSTDSPLTAGGLRRHAMEQLFLVGELISTQGMAGAKHFIWTPLVPLDTNLNLLAACIVALNLNILLIPNQGTAYPRPWYSYFLGQTKCSNYDSRIVPSSFCITINSDGSFTNNNANSEFSYDPKTPDRLSIQLHTTTTMTNTAFVVQHWIPYKTFLSNGYWVYQQVGVDAIFTAEERMLGKRPMDWGINLSTVQSSGGPE